MKISVIGSGMYGLAMSFLLAENNNDILVYFRDKEKKEYFNEAHKSTYYDDFIFNKKIHGTDNLEECFNYSDYIIIAIPTQSICFLNEIIKKYQNKKYLITSKGLYSSMTLSEYINKNTQASNIAILSGPSYANEIVLKKKTAVIIASKNITLAREFQSIFSNTFFRVYTTTDVIGVEYCGAIKNVYAIASGIVDKNYDSVNTRSALLTRSLNEIKEVISYFNGSIQTIFGLAGIGDMMLTCTSNKSRNYRFGYNFNYSTDTKETTEGINTCKEIYNISKKNNLKTPIVDALYNIIFLNKEINEEIDKLMRRPLKDE